MSVPARQAVPNRSEPGAGGPARPRPVSGSLSAFVAFFIDSTEILGLIGQQYDLRAGFWSFMGNFDINKAGFVLVAPFALTWAVALSIWRFGKIEQKWDLAAKASARDEPPDPGTAAGLIRA
jgi:High-affinity nickel-transport protein